MKRITIPHAAAGCGACTASLTAFRPGVNSPFTRHLTHKRLLCQRETRYWIIYLINFRQL